MIHIIITSYNEPKATERAVKAFLEQDIPKPFKIIVADPFPEVKEFINEQFKHNKKVEFYLDPGEGKGVVLNMIFEEIYSEDKNDIIISTDGDVYVNKEAVKEILNSFKDPEIGLVAGRPISTNSRNNKYGYWSHLLLDEMNRTRKKLSDKKEFFELSGYLFGMRNSVIKEFPIGAAEDNVIPRLFWAKNYKIIYNENAQAYVLNPQHFKDWALQKKRNIKAHISLNKLFDDKIKRKNTIFGEAIRGLYVFVYLRNLKELVWSIELLFARLYIWFSAYYEVYFKKEEYKDGWREKETETTKPLD
ncbi:MAG: glycosyltransferase family 2 protein [Candidatus Nanoarchaeia archaeon]|jgi:cellulose synthase/poly-beta-1,6-N-acetylglucosamine synthase-like glycosyltransferase|nr:glycosyltransferase family 2 protein [Candidatus Nanoarchaeia archaeon]|tara:strand:- start:25515 stop:26426 length:912 start_codon:yes stop_codon:yes gene_type:complete